MVGVRSCEKKGEARKKVKEGEGVVEGGRNIDKEGKEEGRRGGGEAQILISDGAPAILLLVVRTWRA